MVEPLELGNRLLGRHTCELTRKGASMNLESAIYLGVAGLVMVTVAFLLGRRTGAGVARQLELEAELTTAHSEQARSEAEAERLRNELEADRQQHDEYRLDVVDHFSGTSDLLRDLTVQYRSVYEHLTRGASTLCPEGFIGLTEGLPPPQLAAPQADLELDPEDITDASDSPAFTAAESIALSEDAERATAARDAAPSISDSGESDLEEPSRTEDTLAVPVNPG
ncbi:MAG: DUF1043 family protein [Myxococcota bacterium]